MVDENPELFVHVQFLNTSGNRAWVKASALVSYEGFNEIIHKPPEKKLKYWKDGLKNANVSNVPTFLQQMATNHGLTILICALLWLKIVKPPLKSILLFASSVLDYTTII